MTSVGGTQFTPNVDVNLNDVDFVPESAWNTVTLQTAGEHETTGGGRSQIFSKPSYQAGEGVPNDGARDVPDIAMIAGPPYVLIILDTDNSDGTTSDIASVTLEGGTSLAAPIWTGISRLLQQVIGSRPGPLNPGIYYLANQGYASNGFRDVLSGDNTYINAQDQVVEGYSAGPRFDLVSGWGTVDIADFVDAFTILAPVAENLKITPAAGNFGTVKVGKAKVIKLRLRNPSSKKRDLSITLLNASITNFPTFSFDNGKSTCLIEETLNPNGSCVLAMIFSPTTTGLHTDTLTIDDDADNNPQLIKLKGTGK